ncbi:MAG: phosphotransferase family protein [Acidimicrobiales bacterium]
MGNDHDDLRVVLEDMGLQVPSTPPADLGSPGRTKVWIVGDHVIKCDDRLNTFSMVRERDSLQFLEGTDLPVPRLLASGQFADTRRWLVMTRLDGEAPPDAERLAHDLSAGLARQLGTTIARLHAVGAPPAFGTWTRVPPRSLVEEAQVRMDALFGMARDEAWIPEPEIAALLGLMDTTLETLTTVHTPVLAHRDVQPRNTLVVAGTLTGLLDFESAYGGDPCEDFRVIGLDWTTPAFAAFCDSYARAGGVLGPDAADRTAHHILSWALVVFAYVGRLPAYLEPARLAVARIEAGERPSVPG